MVIFKPKKGQLLIGMLSCFIVSATHAEWLEVEINGPDKKLGTIKFEDTQWGLVATLNLRGLTPNKQHAFHIHQEPKCDAEHSHGSMHQQTSTSPQSKQVTQTQTNSSPTTSPQMPNPIATPPGNFTTAGPHMGSGQHLGPYSNGHLGDLPVISANAQGVAHYSVLAPRLKVKDLRNHSVMIHEGGDNYYFEPDPVGGGGPRIGCGVVPSGSHRGGWLW